MTSRLVATDMKDSIQSMRAFTPEGIAALFTVEPDTESFHFLNRLTPFFYENVDALSARCVFRGEHRVFFMGRTRFLKIRARNPALCQIGVALCHLTF